MECVSCSGPNLNPSIPFPKQSMCCLTSGHLTGHGQGHGHDHAARRQGKTLDDQVCCSGLQGIYQLHHPKHGLLSLCIVSSSQPPDPIRTPSSSAANTGRNRSISLVHLILAILGQHLDRSGGILHSAFISPPFIPTASALSNISPHNAAMLIQPFQQAHKPRLLISISPSPTPTTTTPLNSYLPALTFVRVGGLSEHLRPHSDLFQTTLSHSGAGLPHLWCLSRLSRLFEPSLVLHNSPTSLGPESESRLVLLRSRTRSKRGKVTDSTDTHQPPAPSSSP